MYVVYIGANTDNGFWKETQDFFLDIASDLNIKYTTLHATNYRQALEEFKNAAEFTPKPNYIIVPQYFHLGEQILAMADEQNISVFIINSGFQGRHVNSVGTPRGKYKKWLGHMYPDDKAVGAELANILADSKIYNNEPTIYNNEPTKQTLDTEMTMIGISGATRTSPGVLRKRGLLSVVKTRDDLKLKRATDTEWNQHDAEKTVTALIEYYGKIDTIWTAGEGLAAGAIDAVTRAGRTPGKHVNIGTIGWAEGSLENIKNKKLHVAIGGHFLEAGLALVLIHDS